MIICVCRGLNTAKVAEAIDAGARSPAQVHRHHNTTINCGKCCETVCSMLRDRCSLSADPAMDGLLVAAE